MSLADCRISDGLLDMRRDLAWHGKPLGEYFHASTDRQEIRDAVFDFLKDFDFQIHATVLEKSKAQPQVRETNARFYKYGWLYHLRYSHRKYLKSTDELHVTAASIGTKKGQRIFSSAVNDVVQQTLRRDQWKASFWPAATDPCLQVADYCLWAIQRKWERGETRSYDLIKNKITHEYDTWSHGAHHYY